MPHFSSPTFGTVDLPELWNIGPSFALPLQRVGPKALTSKGAKTFGVLHIAVRDFAAGEGSTGASGIEIYSAVWYPPWDQASAKEQRDFQTYLADESHHMVVEVVNLTLRAHEDCKGGACVLPTGA